MKSLRIVGPCVQLEHSSHMRVRASIGAVGIALIILTCATKKDSAQSGAADTGTLMNRVGPPSQVSVDAFKGAGMQDVEPHLLTASERAKVKAVLDSLPMLTRHVLEKKLHHLAFVDGIPGEGTGLTSPFGKSGLYDITLRSSLLNESLSTFLMTKERRVFKDDGSGLMVIVEGTGTDALTYVLLHESTHVMDMGCRITEKPRNRFVAGIWTTQRDLVPQLSSSVTATTIFRRGTRIEVGQAAAVYDALAQTPFVSLYATAASSEDLAELVAWHEIQSQHDGDLVITVNDAHGKTLRRWEPLTFPEVQKRLPDVDWLLASRLPCSGLS